MSRRLNQTGMDFIRAQIARVGLFDKSQTRKVVQPPNCCGGGKLVSIVSGGKTIEVADATLPPGSYAPSAAWDRFDELAKSLAQPESWIPSAGWSDKARSLFRSGTFCLMLERDYQDEPTTLAAAELTWPAGVRPFASFGEPNTSTGADNRLGTVPAAAAYQLAASIADRATAASVSPDGFYDTPLSDGGSLLSPWIADPDGGYPVTVDLWPASPGLIACSVSH